MRLPALSSAVGAALLVGLVLSGCGGTRLLEHHATTTTAPISALPSGGGLGIPTIATRNTTRVAGSSPVSDAAGVALAVYPSQSSGSHPTAVTIAPTDDWEAAIASSVLMAAPIHAPVLLSGASALPKVTSQALSALAPTGAGAVDGAQVLRVGAVPAVGHLKTDTVSRAKDPYTLAADIARFQAAAAGGASPNVVIASTGSPAYAMPAAGWAAESGDPVLFVSPTGVPAATRQALQADSNPHIYVLGPKTVISPQIVRTLGRYGTVARVGRVGAAANSVAFAIYRNPACPFGKACAQIPGSFGWAIRSPGHGYTLLNASRPLDAAASAALSGSGDYGPQLLVQDPTTLPKPVLQYFLNYATPGFSPGEQTAAVYNHGWVIGDASAISVPVQSELDTLLQAVPVSSQ
ncbi:MAG TPA: cell wall-binding repeat-containing protein [Solirubrobacteraceae bacterium]|nr:cell wall-binding repeat-containing protein [Solirubrobacteraceae bacterium]